MYLVICCDENIINIEAYGDLGLDKLLFGPFQTKYDAEEWVDNHCNKKYWNIIYLNEKK